MANKIQKFYHEKFGSVRTRFIDGEAWFVGKDVAQALGYKDTKSAILDHVFEDYRKVLNAKIIEQMASQSKGGDSPPLEMASQSKGRKTRPLDTSSPRGMVYLKEAGLYQLIFSSKLPDAADFQRWVFEDVLPTLRREGRYKMIWEEARQSGKVMRRNLTDTIKLFIEYLKETNQLDRPEQVWYIIFSNLAKKTVGIVDERDEMPARTLFDLETCERIIVKAIETGIQQQLEHRLIHEYCKEKLAEWQLIIE